MKPPEAVRACQLVTRSLELNREEYNLIAKAYQEGYQDALPLQLESGWEAGIDQYLSINISKVTTYNR